MLSIVAIRRTTSNELACSIVVDGACRSGMVWTLARTDAVSLVSRIAYPFPSFLPNWQIPTYGTHHTKMMLLKFPTGVRVVVLTANFVSTDVEDKSQGVWYQEFPLRKAETCDFEVWYNMAYRTSKCYITRNISHHLGRI